MPLIEGGDVRRIQAASRELAGFLDVDLNIVARVIDCRGAARPEEPGEAPKPREGSNAAVPKPADKRQPGDRKGKP